jgi:hypothetical protein
MASGKRAWMEKKLRYGKRKAKAWDGVASLVATVF